MTEKEYYEQVDREHSYVEEIINNLDSAYYDGYADGKKQAIDEFAEKLILRLEHEKKGQEYLKFNAGDYIPQANIHKYAIGCYELVIYIVNELAERMKKGSEENG